MNYLDFDFLSFFLIIGVGQGILICTILLFKKPSSIPNKILAGLLIIFTVNLLEFLLLSSKFYVFMPHLMYVTKPFLFLLGPLFYFFVRAYLKPSFSFPKSVWLHLIPFLLIGIYNMRWILQTSEYKIDILTNALSGKNLGVSLIGILIAFAHISQTLTYVFFSLKKIKQENQEEIRSFEKRKKFLLLFTQFFLAYWFIQIIGVLCMWVFQYYVLQIDFALTLINSIFIQSLSFFLLLNPNILSPFPSSKKYEGSSLQTKTYQSILSEIKKLMEKDKVYLDGDLTLQKFSTLLSVNKGYISQVINQEFGYGFTEYVNDFRIKKAKELLIHPDYQHLSLLGIAMESGFNNTTSFNRVFKRIVKQTPSQYRISNQVD